MSPPTRPNMEIEAHPMSDNIRRVSYAPFVGTMPDGTQILVQIFTDENSESLIDFVQVAFRDDPFETWGPPIRTRRA